ncbi:MAG: FtsX-like permease family protein [Crocinitomicaceae bacterium]
MKTEFFIAQKIMRGGKRQNRLSKPIVVISLASIILGVAIMIISVAVVTGFQDGIRKKVIGFGAHIQVMNLFDNSSMESSPILIHQDFYPSLEETEEEVRQIQIFAYKPAILQAKRDSVSFTSSGKDSLRSVQDILGTLFKGVDEDYDWDFFSDKLIEGRLINFEAENDEILISKYIADIMGYKVGDEVEAFFIMSSGPKKRTFTVCGIYSTGFEEFDKQFIFTQIQHIQKLNNWGVQTLLTVDKDSCVNGKFILKSLTVGGSGSYKYKWNDSPHFTEQDEIMISGKFSENIQVVSTDFDREVYGLKTKENSVPDTASAKIIVTTPCACSPELLKEHSVQFESESEIIMPFGKILIENGSGTHNHYTGGFEILLHSWDDLEKMDEIIDFNIPGYMKTKKITEMHPDIFAWLDFLDINILIIIILILVVSLINMITSLLVMILEKANMIGVLKALGAQNGFIRKVFLMNSLYLLSRGLFWGNLLGIGLIALQYYTGILSLNPDVYYLDKVPINFSIWHILLINVLTIIVCRITLILPSFLISRIDPIKAIRFD